MGDLILRYLVQRVAREEGLEHADLWTFHPKHGVRLYYVIDYSREVNGKYPVVQIPRSALKYEQKKNRVGIQEAKVWLSEYNDEELRNLEDAVRRAVRALKSGHYMTSEEAILHEEVGI